MSYQIWGAGFGDPAAEGPPGVVAPQAAEAGFVTGSGAGGSGGAPGGSHEADGAAYGVAALFRDHHAELVRLAVLMTGDRASAEDIVQDVFARLCTRDYLPEASGALAYARAAVLNGCRSALRRRAVARRSGGARGGPARWGRDGGGRGGSARDGGGRGGLARDGWARDLTQASAEHEALLAEDRRQVLVALGRLSRRRREVLVLRYWLGLHEAEIAAVLGISPGTVKSTAARGIAALARELGESA